MDYQELRRRRARRYARRMERRAREERRERILELLGYVVFGVMLYALFYLGCVWAAI